MLIVMAGLPGSGKSAVADEVARTLGCAVLSVDPIEAAMWRAGIGRDQPTGLAAYVVAEDLAREQLRLGNDVVVDAVNDVEPARDQWRALSAELGQRLVFIEVFCSDEREHQTRLGNRRRQIDGFPEPTWESVVARKGGLSDWHDDRVRVDSMRPLAELVDEVLEHLARVRTTTTTDGQPALPLIAEPPNHYLGSDSIIQTDDPGVVALGKELRDRHADDTEFAKAAFEWVRDTIAHAYDAQDHRVTLTASQVLSEGVGLCYAKSNLLAAILRSQGIPAGLCYQRLGDPEEGHVIHGLVAVHLDGVWHRQDPRGNKAGIDAQFSLGTEQLAYVIDERKGQRDYPRLYVSTADEVVNPLQEASDVLTCPLPSDLHSGQAGFMITGLDHVQVAIPIGSEPTAREYYGAVLGMREIPKPTALAVRGGCWFTSGSAVLHLGVEEPFAPAKKAHPAFLVTDLDALAAALEEGGGSITPSDGELPGIRRFHTSDPFGNRLEFQQA